jgi:hypothetical protein
MEGSFRMRRTLQGVLITVVAGAAAACVSGQRSEASDPVVLSIEVGRYAYMLTQTAELAPAAAAEPPAGQSAPAQGAQRAALQSQLVETAFTLNAQRARLCRDAVLPGLTCVAPFRPTWLNAPPGAAPDAAVLQARADELGAQVMALWDAVCAAAPKNPDEPLGPCPIE